MSTVKTIFSIIFFLLFSYLLYGKGCPLSESDLKVDSLVRKKIKMFSDSAFKLAPFNAELAFLLTDSSMILSKKYSYNRGVGSSFLERGFIFHIKISTIVL